MKIVYIKRRTRKERRYTKKMGMFLARVTYIKKHVLGIPISTLHKYRETYYGEVKDCENCKVSA